jgi:hypothetical protein
VSLVTTHAEMPFRCLKTCARKRRDRSGRPCREVLRAQVFTSPYLNFGVTGGTFAPTTSTREGCCGSVRLPLTLGEGDGT